MKLNPEIKNILQFYNINIDKGYLCLLGIYYGLDIDQIYDEVVVKQINLTKIVEKDYKTNSLTWNIPLFEGIEYAFEWVSSEYNILFKQLNSKRASDSTSCILRMKKLFSLNPDIRKEEVIEATKLYLETVNDPEYLKSSHKFIYEGNGVSTVWHIKSWIERYREFKASQSEEKTATLNTIMQ